MDGDVYRRQSEQAKRDGSFCISLYWHLDGAPALKSQNMSLWPIQSFVAEMPPSLRYSFKNIVLSGLWYGKKKPEMTVFQNSFVEETKVLSKRISDRWNTNKIQSCCKWSISRPNG